MLRDRLWPFVIAVGLLVVVGAGCAGSDDEATESSAAPAGSAGASTEDGLGWCDDVTVEEFQQLFGERFTVVKRGGVANDCTIVAQDTYIGEALAITNYTRVGYGPTFDEARTTADGDYLCPDGSRDVEGLGDRAFYVPTCDPDERPAESLHIEADGEYLRFLAFDIPIEQIATTEESLLALATRLLG